MSRNAKLFVISGPSGAGKGTLVAALRDIRPDLALTVSATTRAPRPHEVHGSSYWYMSQEEFDQNREDDCFVEWAEVHGNMYGTLKSEVDDKIDLGHSVILEIDPQGALQVQEKYPEAVLVFIMPPSLEELERRLVARHTETPAEVQRRMNNARHEIAKKDLYSAVIVNDSLERATQELLDVIQQYESK